MGYFYLACSAPNSCPTRPWSSSTPASLFWSQTSSTPLVRKQRSLHFLSHTWSHCLNEHLIYPPCTLWWLAVTFLLPGRLVYDRISSMCSADSQTLPGKVCLCMCVCCFLCSQLKFWTMVKSHEQNTGCHFLMLDLSLVIFCVHFEWFIEFICQVWAVDWWFGKPTNTGANTNARC